MTQGHHVTEENMLNNVPGKAAYATDVANRTATDRPLGHIPLEVQEHERLCLTLQDEISSLEARIGPVLRPSVPECPSATGNMPAAPVTSECASAVAELNRQLHRAILRVRDLAARADL